MNKKFAAFTKFIVMISLLLPSLLTSNITPDHATRGASKHLDYGLDYLESDLELVVPEGGEGIEPSGGGELLLPANISRDWWTIVREDIRLSEYHLKRLKQSNLTDSTIRYQAPNRAHNMRTSFSPTGIRVVPRVGESESKNAWTWSLSLIGYGYEDQVQTVETATLSADGNRIEYQRSNLIEWYINDERGLEQGFTLAAPPQASTQNPKSSLNESEHAKIAFDLALQSNLIPSLAELGTAIDFITADGGRVLRYSDLYAYDAMGRVLPTQLRLVDLNTIRLIVDDTHAVYPIVVDPLATNPNWTAESDQTGAKLGHQVGSAGDVNGDGYSDVIIGALHYDNGETDEGRAYVYYGSGSGLSTTAAWVAESNQAGAIFGAGVGTAGDVNGDGYADVIIAAPTYDNGQVDEGRVFVYYGSSTGLSQTADWMAEGDQAGSILGDRAVGTAGDVNGDGYSDVIVGTRRYDNGQTDEGRAYVYYGSAVGLGGTPDWTTEGDQSGAELGRSVSTAGDVNGDGYSDVIIGAFLYDNGHTDEGVAFVHYGSATGLSQSAAWMVESNNIDAQFGVSVATAGDVNGDGYSDVIVGASGYDNGQTDEGKAYVYYGSASGLSSVDNWTVEGDQPGAGLGHSVATAGDVNGDGYADVIVGALWYDAGQIDEGQVRVYYGSPAGLNPVADWTAESNQAGAGMHAVATAGDVNGDGYSDVVLGAYRYDNGQTDEGSAFVYYGGSAGPRVTADWTAESDQAGADFGVSARTAGDVNGDGYADVIVGARFYDNGQTDEGRVFAYYGSASGLSTIAEWTAESNQTGAWFGLSVGTAGDVNGDGYADVVVGAPTYDDGQTTGGRAYVYYGSPAGLISTATWISGSPQLDADFGHSVGTAGDVNGDGYNDVIVGAPTYDNGQTDEGRAYVFYGSASGLSTIPDWTAESNQANTQYGYAAGTAGDVNGDGYSDVIVGARFYDNGQIDEGRAYVFYGSASGLSTIPDWTAESNQANAWFGTSVSTAGDVNGDGYSDVIIGAIWYTNGQTGEGRAFVYPGSATGLSITASWTAESDQAYAYFGSSVGTAGDVNGDGYADVIVGAMQYDNGQFDEGRAYVYAGSATGLSTTPNWTAESDQTITRFGASVGTAGDVNGDGYADVIIGARLYDNGHTDEGQAFVYYGNAGPGLSLTPRQMRTDGATPIQPLGLSDSGTSVRLQLTGRTPLGREDVRLQWQVAPLGEPFTGTNTISGSSVIWTDVLTSGVVISEHISDLTPGRPYHWRVRLLYRPGNALGQPASRWIHLPWHSWTEQDFRTKFQEEAIEDLTATNDSPTVLGQTTHLTATISAGTNVSYTWNFGDGETGSGEVTSHTYAALGAYTAVVTASNPLSVVTASTTVDVIAGSPDLSISKIGPASAIAGEPISYTLRVTNAGSASSTNLIITDAIPYGAYYISGGSEVGDEVHWTVSELGANGSVAEVTFVVTASAAISSLINSDYGLSADGGFNAIGSHPVETGILPSCKPVSDVHLSRIPSGPLFAGHPVQFMASVVGDIPLSYTWTLDGTPVGDNLSVFEHIFDLPGAYTVQVTISNQCGQGDKAVTVTVFDEADNQPDLSQSYKSVNLTSVEPGDTLNYTIYLHNSNPVTASVTLIDPIPAHTAYVPLSAQASDGSVVTVDQVSSPIGNGTMITASQVLTWMGQVLSGTPVIINFSVEVQEALIDTVITNVAYLEDGFGHTIELAAYSTYNFGYWLTINEGALYTNHSDVNLRYAWNTYDDIVSVKFSNDGGFGPEGDTTDWLPVTPDSPIYEGWTLATYGNLRLPRTVYVKFRDGLGRQYGPFQDDIIYDPYAPSIIQAAVFSQTDQRRITTVGEQVIVQVMAEDDNSGVDKVQLSHNADFSSASEFTMTGKTVNLPWTLQAAGEVYVWVTDRAGNISAVSKVQASVDHTIYLPLLLER